MIYLERNDNNSYTVRIQNTINKGVTEDLAGKEFHLILVNTVTKEKYTPLFTVGMMEPYFNGSFTQEMADGEYEYTLYYVEDENTVRYIENGLLNIGNISENRTIPDTNEGGDIVYNG